MTWLQLRDWSNEYESDVDGSVRYKKTLDRELFGICFNGDTHWLKPDSTLFDALTLFNHDELHNKLKKLTKHAEEKMNSPNHFTVKIETLASGDPEWFFKGETYFKFKNTQKLKSKIKIPVAEYLKTLPEFGDF
jgi:hypothetical protein